MKALRSILFVTFLIAVPSARAEAFSTSALNPTPVDSIGIITGSFPTGGGRETYYFSVPLHKGDLLTQISFTGRANVDKKLELTLLDTEQHSQGSYYIYAGLDSNQEKAHLFPIDSTNQYLIQVTVDGPESTSFRVELGGSAVGSERSPAVQTSFSTSALSPGPVPKNGVITGIFPSADQSHNTYYYFTTDLTKGSLITQIRVAGRADVDKKLEFALLTSDMHVVGSYYTFAGIDENSEHTKVFPIDSIGRYIVRLTLQGRENTKFQVEIGGNAFSQSSPMQASPKEL